MLKEIKEKKTGKSRLIDEEDVPPTNVVEVDNEETSQEHAPLVRKTSKNAIFVKQKKVLSDKNGKEVDVEKERVEKENLSEIGRVAVRNLVPQKGQELNYLSLKGEQI